VVAESFLRAASWSAFRRNQQGQVLALTAIAMVGICGVAGFAVDVGVWFQAHRKQQAIADAAALAAAGSLPTSTGQAAIDAQSYAAKNGGSVASLAFSTQYLPNDTVTVVTTKTVPSHFLNTVGIGSADVTATAVARAETLGSAWGAAPFAVVNTQPELAGFGCPCFGVSTTLSLNKVGPGGFQVIDIDGSQGGTGPGTLASWIVNGCDCSTTAPVYLYSDPGAKFNSSQVQGAMNQMLGHDLLFPVYDTTSGSGANMQYHVIGFAGFNIQGDQFQGNSGSIDGSFVKVDWEGAGTSDTSTYFGATTTRLVG
jgi:Flp pilus assembly protein TadG